MNSVYPRDYINIEYKIRRGECFVIMPFAAKFSEIFDVIRDAIKSLNFVCLRGDELSERNILKSIICSIANSELVIADLTDRNPNVFYELGIAHCFKDANHVILIAQNIEDVPFDLRHLRTIIYTPSISGGKKLYFDLEQAIKGITGDTYYIRLAPNGEPVCLPELIKGDGNFLYEIEMFCTYSSKLNSKLGLQYTMHMYDGRSNKIISPHGVTLDAEFPSTPLQHVPWFARAVKMDDQCLELIVQKR